MEETKKGEEGEIRFCKCLCPIRHSLIHSFPDSFIPSFADSTPSFLHSSFLHPVLPSFLHSFICPFLHPSIECVGELVGFWSFASVLSPSRLFLLTDLDQDDCNQHRLRFQAQTTASSEFHLLEKAGGKENRNKRDKE